MSVRDIVFEVSFIVTTIVLYPSAFSLTSTVFELSLQKITIVEI